MDAANEQDVDGVGSQSWREIHGQLVRVAKARSGLDAEEVRWILAAEREEVFRQFGCVHIVEYLERVLGYRAKDVIERLRVAHCIEQLPQTFAALERGELKWSAVRELTRVVMPSTEGAWISEAAGKTVREVESMVSGRKKGDLPTDPEDPELVPRRLVLEVSQETYVLYREACKRLEQATCGRMDDDGVVAAMSLSVLNGGGECDGGVAPYQIALTECECGRAMQAGGGVVVDVAPETLEMAKCDAVHLGKVDGAMPERAYQDVSPAVRRAVLARDNNMCTAPGCNVVVFLNLHHIEHRAHGGSHTPPNLTTVCHGHHCAVHDGKLVISGEAPSKLTFEWPVFDAIEAECEEEYERQYETSRSIVFQNGAQPHVGTMLSGVHA